MDFVTSAVKYIKQNFVKLVLLSLFPSVLLTVISGFSKIPEFLVDLSADANTLAEIFPYYSIINNSRTWLSIVILLVVLLWAGITMSYIQRSIRIGKFRLSRLLDRLDESLFSVLPMGLILLALFELVGFLTALLILLASGITTGVGLSIIAAILTVLFFLVYFSMFAMFVFAIPCMLEVGYGFSAAVSQTVKQMQRHILKVGLVLFVLYFFTAFLAYGAKTFLTAAWSTVVHGILYLISFMFLCSFIITGYNRINK